jgi:hypothetical protein
MRTTIDIPAIAELIDNDGSITISTVKRFGCIAAAHDGKECLVMLRRRPMESCNDLLKRLNAAIATAEETGENIDEVNTTPAPPKPTPTRRSRR